jgi:hypothetical protein
LYIDNVVGQGRLGNALWFGMPKSAKTTRTLVVGSSPRMPPGLLDEAIALPKNVLSWTPLIARSAEPLRAAAEQIIQVAHVVERARRQAVVGGYPEDIEIAVSLCVQRWVKAHTDSVTDVLELAPGGLWPYRLWSFVDFQVTPSDLPCVHCGVAPTLERLYRSYPTGRRRQWECWRCDLIHDLPMIAGYPRMEFSVPHTLTASTPMTARLVLDHSRGEVDCFGAGAILVDGQNHGVRAAPATIPIQVPCGLRFETTATLSLAGPPPVSQMFRVRALLLLNGNWWLFSRHISVSA